MVALRDTKPLLLPTTGAKAAHAAYHAPIRAQVAGCRADGNYTIINTRISPSRATNRDSSNSKSYSAIGDSCYSYSR